MSQITLPKSNISLSDRKNNLSKILQELTYDQIIIIPKSPNETFLKLVARSTTYTGSDWTKWQFTTRNTNYIAKYYENWKQEDDNFVFYKSILNIYTTAYGINEEPNEFILLHCEPFDKIDSISKNRFKRGYHLHFKETCNFIPNNAHIALTSSDRNLGCILSDIRELNEALKFNIEMINKEILDNI
jgi:hypothetical protein